ncbi:MAG: DUF2141 domain-containing protein [Pontixanthobacter sp.]
MIMRFNTGMAAIAAAGVAGSMLITAPAQAQYRQTIGNDLSKCRANAGPSVMVTVRGIEGGSGTMRVQSYKGTKGDWLASGRWLNRIESRAQAGTMRFCVPVPQAGTYAIAIRHDKNGNGKTDLRSDGGGMSGNPSISIFNLGKPSYTKTRFDVGNGPTAITIDMKYM